MFKSLRKKFNPAPEPVAADNTQSFSGSYEKSFNFAVTPAEGGYIVSARHYDSVKDRTVENLYVISSDDNFDSAITTIIAKEYLTR